MGPRNISDVYTVPKHSAVPAPLVRTPLHHLLDVVLPAPRLVIVGSHQGADNMQRQDCHCLKTAVGGCFLVDQSLSVSFRHRVCDVSIQGYLFLTPSAFVGFNIVTTPIFFGKNVTFVTRVPNSRKGRGKDKFKESAK